MSEDKKENEEELNPEDALDVADSTEVEEDLDEFIEDDETAVDEVDEVDEELEKAEAAPEKGACLVIGQGDFSMCQSNRGADDPGDNTLSEPQHLCKYGQMVFVSDRGNHRVLVWDTPPEESGAPATVVLGQEDFADCLENRGITTTLDEMTSGLGDENLEGFTISKAEEDTLSQPAGLEVIDGKLYISDSGNHRVLRWDTLPTEDGEPPSMVLGQDNLDCNEANRRGLVGSGSLFFPMGVRSGDDQHVFVADKDNHRVLIWNKIPFNNGWNADIALGQSGMDEREPNRGDFENVGPNTMSFPTGVFYHAETDKLFVVDQGNNRVLIWNKLPSDTGKPADLVIGQKDMSSREVNRGAGARRAVADGLYFPTDVVYGKTGLFVSDSGNNRVLYWEDIPTENGQPADRVLGQTDFNMNRPNRGSTESTHATLNDPYGLFLEEELEEDFEEEGSEETGPKFKLYIADRGNSRVTVWDELPDVPKTEEEEEEDLEAPLLVDAPDTLIGDEEEEVYVEEEAVEEEEGEETSSEEISST